METNIALEPAHQERKKGSEPAGFNIDGQRTDPDVIYSFDLYDTFDIEFESSPSESRSHLLGRAVQVIKTTSLAGQDNFILKWNEVIQERRLQRLNLEKIDEGMKRETFTSAHAREIW